MVVNFTNFGAQLTQSQIKNVMSQLPLVRQVGMSSRGYHHDSLHYTYEMEALIDFVPQLDLIQFNVYRSADEYDHNVKFGDRSFFLTSHILEHSIEVSSRLSGIRSS